MRTPPVWIQPGSQVYDTGCSLASYFNLGETSGDGDRAKAGRRQHDNESQVSRIRRHERPMQSNRRLAVAAVEFTQHCSSAKSTVCNCRGNEWGCEHELIRHAAANPIQYQ